MNKFRSILLGLLLLSICGVAVSGQKTIIENEDIIALSKAGISEKVIINQIRSSKTKFSFSNEDLISLQNANISEAIIVAMQNAESRNILRKTVRSEVSAGVKDAPAVGNYGIYLLETGERGKQMFQLKPNISATSREGGLFTNRITYGIGKRKTKAKLRNKNAELQISNSDPVFYFYLDEKSGGLNTVNGIPSTTNEFILIKFHVKKTRREVTIAKRNAFGSKNGLSKEYIVSFDSEYMGDGIFTVSPSKSLKTGEYAFYLVNSGTSNAGTAMGTKFFDFGIKLAP